MRQECAKHAKKGDLREKSLDGTFMGHMGHKRRPNEKWKIRASRCRSKDQKSEG
jgi:hypothetical protein